jgi:hypothetical protein
MSKSTSRFSLVLDIEPANPSHAYEHFTGKLAYETDPADLSVDISKESPAKR